MVHRKDLPHIEPTELRRRISAKEVLALSRGGRVPGVAEADPRVRAIRGLRLDNPARMDLAEALRAGYLFVNVRVPEAAIAAHLEQLWGWWCAAAGHPEIVLGTDRVSDAARIRCDLSSSEGRWDFAAWRTIGRMLSQLAAVDRADWLFTPEELRLDGLEMEEAIAIARGLVDVTTAGRFRPETLAVSEDGPPHVPPLSARTRMERPDER